MGCVLLFECCTNASRTIAKFIVVRYLLWHLNDWFITLAWEMCEGGGLTQHKTILFFCVFTWQRKNNQSNNIVKWSWRNEQLERYFFRPEFPPMGNKANMNRFFFCNISANNISTQTLISECLLKDFFALLHLSIICFVMRLRKREQMIFANSVFEWIWCSKRTCK